MKILVVNAGSSSLKYQLIDMEGEKVIAKGQVERIAIEGGHLKQTSAAGQVIETTKFVKDHVEATEMMLAALQDPEKGVIKSVDEIGAVGHRVLHGGKEFSESVVINDAVKAAIRRCIPLGPLHNPANLMGIEACEKVMPTTPQVAVFDTAFHQTMPPKAYMYGVPKKYEETIGVRRYGFHGTSHRFVSKAAAEYLGKNPADLKIVTCHLGNGSSVAAVDGGKVLDTTMGMTPLSGLLMGTRSGDMDPSIPGYIENATGMTPSEFDAVMNKKSGLLGISGVSSDKRDIDNAAAEGNERAQLAKDMLVYQIKKYIGGYAAAMGGLDCVVFCGGIGENDNDLRAAVCDKMEVLGIGAINKEQNDKRGLDINDITGADSKVKVLAICTNEELMIARDTKEIVEAL